MSLITPPPFGSGQVVRTLIALMSQIGRLFGAVALAAALSTTAFAQTSTAVPPAPVVREDISEIHFPGSFWASYGNITPFEEDNFIGIVDLDQGVSFRGVELFGSVTASFDSDDYDWNRWVAYGPGVRFTQTLGNGMVRAGVQYLTERRYEEVRRAWSFVVESWFGWGRD